LENVRGKDVYVVQSLHGDFEQSANDKLCRLLFFLGALRDAAAGRLTAVVPFLCYSRKERKTQPRDPVTTRYVAGFFEAVGVDRGDEVHNVAAFQNAFRCRTEHLEAHGLFAEPSPIRSATRLSRSCRPTWAGSSGRTASARSWPADSAGRSRGLVEKRCSADVVSGALVGDVATAWSSDR
jgi:ribose-phosphate pyrophosphokinase